MFKFKPYKMEETKNKIVGIALDNYKISKFKKTLIKKGFNVIDVIKLNEDAQVIQVDCPSKELHKLSKLVNSLEVLFKNRN